MATVHDDRFEVQPEPAALWPAWTDEMRYATLDDLDDLDVSDEDARWACETAPEPDPTLLTDLARLRDEWRYWLGRAQAADDGYDGLVAGCFGKLVSSMRFHRVDSAAGLARALKVDLGRVWAPGTGARRSPLAAALDVQASYYLHDDTAAGRLAAYELEMLADLAEDMGSATAEDWVADEAAWRAAAIEAVCEGRVS